MKNFLIAALVACAAPAASAQDELDARLEELASKLSKEGPSARLGELCGSLYGRDAIKEKIGALVNHRAGRLDRDPQGHYEEYLFVREESGALRVRPERKAELEALAAEVAAAPKRMDAFNRRVFALVGRIAGDGGMEKKARAWWSDSTFRIAFFNSRAGELQEQEAEQLLHDLLGRGLVRKDDGRLRVEGPAKQEVRDYVQGTYGQLDQVKELEKSYLKNLAEAGDDARKALVTDTAVLFVLGRLLREANEGAEGAIGAVAEADTGEKSVSFNVPLAAMLEPLRDCEKALAELKPWFEKTATALSGAGVDELEMFDFLKNERARVLVVERLVATRRAQRQAADKVFEEILADGFEAEGAALKVKKGRYVDENKADSVEALDGEHKGMVDGFWGGRYPLDLIAELAADPKAAETFGSPAGTIVIQEHIGRVAAELRQAIEAQGFELFTRLYLSKKGDALEVRPERAAKIQELSQRAAQLKKEAGQDP